MRTMTTKVLATAALLAVWSATPLTAQQHADHEAAGHRGMMHAMMQDCPMAGGHMMGMMMGAEGFLEQAEELGLTAEQVAELELLREQLAEPDADRMAAMHAIHEVLTPEQREAMREMHHDAMQGGEHARMQGMEGMPGMMHSEGHGAMHGLDHAMMESCPMMRMGGEEGAHHRHGGHTAPPGGR